MHKAVANARPAGTGAPRAPTKAHTLRRICSAVAALFIAGAQAQPAGGSAGQVVRKLKTSWRDGTTHLVMSPLEFMQRLAALVPRHKLHLIRFGVRITSLREVSGLPLRDHGVLAPNAELRALVVPQEPRAARAAPAQAAPPAECEAICAHHRPVRLSRAQLLKRVFELDLKHCPHCGGELKLIAAILEVSPDTNGPEYRLCLAHARASVPWQPVIEKILTHLGSAWVAPGSQARAPPRAPARGPQLQAA